MYDTVHLSSDSFISTAFSEAPAVATSTAGKLGAALSGKDQEVIDDSECGGRGCCDEQVAAANGIAKPINITQLIPEIAAISFGLGMCCVLGASGSGKSKPKPRNRNARERDESESD